MVVLVGSENILQTKGQWVIFMATSFTGNCLRPLGPSEQYFWLSDQNSAKHFVIAAEIVGDATVEAWVSAIAAAQLRHPLLRVAVEYGSDGHHESSSAFVIRDILEALSGKPLQPLTLTDPQENLCSAVAGTPLSPSAPVHPPATLLRRDAGEPSH
jgi:hypothetical protein